MFLVLLLGVLIMIFFTVVMICHQFEKKESSKLLRIILFFFPQNSIFPHLGQNAGFICTLVFNHSEIIKIRNISNKLLTFQTLKQVVQKSFQTSGLGKVNHLQFQEEKTRCSCMSF